MKALRIFLALAVLAVAGGFSYIYFSGGSGVPSTDLTTPGISSNTTGTTAA